MRDIRSLLWSQMKLFQASKVVVFLPRKALGSLIIVKLAFPVTKKIKFNFKNMCCREYRLSQRQKHFWNVVYGTVRRIYLLFNNYYVILGCKGINLGHAVLSNLMFSKKLLKFFSYLFFVFRYLNAIQTTCPHILRYLTTAVITNKRRRTVLKDLVKVIQQESYTYKDPITEFLECLYVNFDFDGAQQKLRECETVSVPIVTVVKDLSFCMPFVV